MVFPVLYRQTTAICQLAAPFKKANSGMPLLLLDASDLNARLTLKLEIATTINL